MNTQSNSNVNNTSARPTTLRAICVTALCGALGAVLMYFDFPLTFLVPFFYKLDFSEIPCLICGFALGPVWGGLAELVKIIIKLILKPTSTMFVGELSNLLLGCVMVVTASLLYQIKKTLPRAIHSLGIGTLLMAICGGLLNAFVLIPFYLELFGITEAQLLGYAPAFADTLPKLVLLCVIPFNLLKGAADSILTGFLYKPLKKILLWSPKKK